jgi:hypothetical protein
MRVLYALICEGASARPDGRVDVHGIFHQLFAPGFPAQQDHLVVAIAIEWDGGESGRKEFRIDLVDPSRSPALTINGHTDVSSPKPGEAPPQTRLVMPLDNVIFPASGTYLFELHVGDEAVPLCPLHLVENPEGTEPAS